MAQAYGEIYSPKVGPVAVGVTVEEAAVDSKPPEQQRPTHLPRHRAQTSPDQHSRQDHGPRQHVKFDEQTGKDDTGFDLLYTNFMTSNLKPHNISILR